MTKLTAQQMIDKLRAADDHISSAVDLVEDVLDNSDWQHEELVLDPLRQVSGRWGTMRSWIYELQDALPEEDEP